MLFVIGYVSVNWNCSFFEVNYFDIICSIRNKVVYFNIIVYDFDIFWFMEIYFDCIVINESLMLDGFKIIYCKDRNCIKISCY